MWSSKTGVRTWAKDERSSHPGIVSALNRWYLNGKSVTLFIHWFISIKVPSTSLRHRSGRCPHQVIFPIPAKRAHQRWELSKCTDRWRASLGHWDPTTLYTEAGFKRSLGTDSALSHWEHHMCPQHKGREDKLPAVLEGVSSRLANKLPAFSFNSLGAGSG